MNTKDPLQSYRQPMVTATGLLLGFTLGFAATWVQTDNPLGTLQAVVVGGCILSGTIAMIATLFRIMDNNYPRDEADAYYAWTLRLFIFGICVTFVGVFFDMAITFVTGDSKH
jgi:hypothetical protein